MTQNKLLKRRIRHLKAVATLLQMTPFLRCILLNGSFAEGKVRQSSDIDLLIIAKDKRMFTARFIAVLLTWITGLKRSPDDNKDASGRFCLNYYLTESFLIVPIGREKEIDAYCAKNYSKSLMVWGDRDIFFKFFKTNRENWNKYLNKSSTVYRLPFTVYPRKVLKSNFPIRTWHTGVRLRNVVEKILGERTERLLKNIQLKKINSDPRTRKHPTYIVANDKEMRFHPPE